MNKIIKALLVFVLLTTLVECSSERTHNKPKLKSISLLGFGDDDSVGFRIFDIKTRTVSEISLSPKWEKQPEDQLISGKLQLKDGSWEILLEAARKIKRSGGIVSSQDLSPASLVTLTYENGVSRSFFFFAPNYRINRWLFKGTSEELQLASVLLYKVTGKRTETVLTPVNRAFRDAASNYYQLIADAQSTFNTLYRANRGWRSYVGGLNKGAVRFFSITDWMREYIANLMNNVAKPASGNNPQLEPTTKDVIKKSGNP